MATGGNTNSPPANTTTADNDPAHGQPIQHGNPPTANNEGTRNENGHEMTTTGQRQSMTAKNDEWSTIATKQQRNVTTTPSSDNEQTPLPTGLREFSVEDLVDIIDPAYKVPQFRITLKISLTDGPKNDYNKDNNYWGAFKSFYKLVLEQDSTAMILAWNKKVPQNPITRLEEIPDIKTLQQSYTFNRRLSDNNSRIDMTIIVASAIAIHEVLKKGQPYRTLQQRKWYVHLTDKRYLGEQISIGWLMEIHPVFTNVFTFKDEITTAFPGVTKHLSLAQKSERWKYNDVRGNQKMTNIRVLSVQAPKELGPRTQKDLFDKWKDYKDNTPTNPNDTIVSGMFIPYDVELFAMLQMLHVQKEFLENHQHSVQIYKCKTLTKPFIVPDALTEILAVDPGKEITLHSLILSMKVAGTEEKLVRSIQRADQQRFHLVVHKNNIEACRTHMHRAIEILRINVPGWQRITETIEGGSMVPDGYTQSIILSPGKAQQKRDYLTGLTKSSKRMAITQEEFQKTNSNVNIMYGGRGRGRGRGPGRGRGRNQHASYKNAVSGQNEDDNTTLTTTNSTSDTSGEIYFNQLVESTTANENSLVVNIPKPIETMLNTLVSNAVTTITAAHTATLTTINTTITNLSTDMELVKETINDEHELNETVAIGLQGQITKIGEGIQINNRKITDNFQQVIDTIERGTKTNDENNISCFNEILLKLREGNYQPIQPKTTSDNQPTKATEPTVTPVKDQYKAPTNETRHTPINIDDPDDQGNNKTITQEEQEAMEAVMTQCNEEAAANLRLNTPNRGSTTLTANNNKLRPTTGPTTLNTLSTKFKQTHTSNKYQAPNTRSKSSGESVLGKTK